MRFRRDTKFRRTDRTPDYGRSGRAAARRDAGASRSELRLWAAVVGRAQVCTNGPTNEEHRPDQERAAHQDWPWFRKQLSDLIAPGRPRPKGILIFGARRWPGPSPCLPVCHQSQTAILANFPGWADRRKEW